METVGLSQTREIVYWTYHDGAEDLFAVDIEEAMQDWREWWEDNYDESEPLPETVELHGFARMDMPTAERLAGRPLEDLLERLDEDHAGEHPTDPTPAMKEAELTFILAVLAEYKSWACGEVEARIVRVADYPPDPGADR